MRLYISTILILLLSSNVFSQKDNIKEAPIRGSILKIEAEAISVLKVNMTITPTIDFDTDTVGFHFPIIFKATPFNKLTFTSKIKDNLKKLYEYQLTTEKTTTLSQSSYSLNASEKEYSNLATFIKNQSSEAELIENFGKKDPTVKEIVNELKSTKAGALNEYIRDKIKTFTESNDHLNETDSEYSILAGFIKNQFSEDELKEEFRKEAPSEKEIIAVLKDSKKIEAINKIVSKKLKTLLDSSDSLNESEKKYATLAFYIKNQFSEAELIEKIGKKDPSEKEIIAILKDSAKIDAIKEFVKNKAASRIEVFEKDFLDHLKNYYKKDNTTEIAYYTSKNFIDEKVSSLFNYFEAQIILLFKYDTEPVAGTLFYKTKINNVQYFPNKNSEKYFGKRTKNYDRLIRKLSKIRKNYDTISIDTFEKDHIKKHLINEDSIRISISNNVHNNVRRLKDTISKINSGFVCDFNSFIDKIEAINNFENIDLYLPLITKQFFTKNIILPTFENYYSNCENDIADILNEHFIDKKAFTIKLRPYKEKYDSILSKLSDSIKEVKTKTNKIVKDKTNDKKLTEAIDVKDYYSRKPLERSYINEIVSHFKNEGREYKEKYLANPKLFLYNFRPLAEAKKILSRKERLNIINEKILKLKNKETYLKLNSLFERSYENKDTLNRKKIVIKYFELKQGLDVLSLTNKNTIVTKLELEQEKIKIINGFKLKKGEKDTIDRNNYTQADIDEIPTLVHELKKTEGNSLDSIKRIETINTLGELIKRFDKNRLELVKTKKSTVTTDALIIKQNEIILNLIKENSFLNNSNKIKAYYNSSSNFDLNKKLSDLNERIFKELKKVPLWEFTANDIQIDINDGFSEHIVITGKITGISKQNEESKSFNKALKEFIKNNPEWDTNIGKQLKFTNIYPYGFSSTKDFEVFKKRKVYVYKDRNKQFEFELEAMFPNYVQTVQNDRLDFSPKDQVVNLPEPGKKDGSVELRKEKSSKLFNIVVYSDFAGLKEKNPNGVLQFELNKYIPLVTQKAPFFVWPYSRSNLGFFNYIEPQITWSRLNANNDTETLALSYVDTFTGNSQDSIPYVTQLDLLRYENISVGATVNLITFDYSTAKIRLEFNAGGKFGRTKVVDTKGRDITTENIVEKYEINTWRFYPEFKLYLRPEERYGLDLNFRVIRNNSVSNDFSIISSEEQFLTDLTDQGEWLHQIEINAHFSPASRKNDRFFFRYRYTNTTSWEYNGFSEIQVGYSMSLKM